MNGARSIALVGACVVALAAVTAGLAAQDNPAPSTASAAAAPAAAPAAPQATEKSAASETPAAPAAQYSRKGADTCLVCHEDPHLLAIFKTAHGRRSDDRAPFGAGQLQCEACHGPGGAHAARVKSGQTRPAIPMFGSASTASVEQQNATCLGCHGQTVHRNWPGSAHEREGVACVSCHAIHPAHDPVLVKAAQPETCMKCHPRARAQSFLPFAHPMRQDRMACSDCHNPHGANADFALVGRTLNDTCYTCHAEKRGPYLWEHAPVAEDCSICHQPHGSSYPGLLTQRPPLLCQQCHSEAGHPSVALSPNQLPTGLPSAQALGRSCMNCHSQIHGSNHPSGAALQR
jgi:DmsE family decaheme c-type cytochrome